MKSPQAVRNYLHLTTELLREPLVGQFKRQHLNLLKGIFSYYLKNRSKVIEGFIQALTEDKDIGLIEYFTAENNEPKEEEGFSYNYLKIGVNTRSSKLLLIEGHDMKINEIIDKCDPLLSEKMEKEEEVKKTRGRSRRKSTSKKTLQKITVSEYMSNFELKFPEIKVPKEYTLGIKIKKRKTENGTDDIISGHILIEDFLLTIYLQLIKRLLSDNWYTRNVTAIILKEFLLYMAQQPSFIVQHLLHLEVSCRTAIVAEVAELPYESKIVTAIKQDLAVRLLAGITADHFTDYLENTISAPVRESFGKLLGVVLDQGADINGNIVEDATKVIVKPNTEWMSRYNSILLLKYLIKHWKKLKTLENYYNLLRKPLLIGLCSEDEEIRIISCRLLKKCRALVCKDHSYYLEIVKSIFKNIKKLDDIECSAIDMLALLEALFHEDSALIKTAIGFIDLKLIFVFAYHRLQNIRYKAYSLVFRLIEQLFKTLGIETIKRENADLVNDLYSLLVITIQGVAMESSQNILKTLVKGFSSIINLIDPKDLHEWHKEKMNFFHSLVTSKKITDFKSFLFFKTEEYAPTNTYYAFISEPADSVELEKAFNRKTYYLTKLYARLAILNKEILQELIALYKLNQSEEGPMLICDSAHIAAYILYWVSKDIKLDWVYTWAEGIINKEEHIGKITEYMNLPQLTTFVEIIKKFALCYPQEKTIVELALADIKADRTKGLNLYMTALKRLYQQQKEQGINQCSTALFFLECNKLKEPIEVKKNNVKALASAILIAISRHRKRLPDRLNPIIKPLTIFNGKNSSEYVLELTGKTLAELQWLNQKNIEMNEKISSVVFETYIAGNESPMYITNYLKKYIKLHGSSAFEVNNESIKKHSLKCLTDCINHKLSTCNVSVNLEMNLLLSMLSYTILELHRKFLWTVFDVLLQFIEIIGEDVEPAIRFVTDMKPIADARVEVKGKFESKIKPLVDGRIIPETRIINGTRRNELTETENLTKELLLSIVKILKVESYEKMTLTFVKIITEKKYCGCRIISDFVTSIPRDYMIYLPYFILPIIRNFSSSSLELSELSYHLFSNILKILPIGDTSIFSTVPKLQSTSSESARIEKEGLEGVYFLKSFLTTEQTYDYKLSIHLKEKLREYQVAGISWMAFMHRYNINCALCDDMGLGKTIQALVLIANEMYLLGKTLPSLVICPTTLMKNWLYEILKFFDEKTIKGKIYTGGPIKRSFFNDSQIIITSYERVRAHIDDLKNYEFFYIILDEAHVIKNSKAKVSQAVKLLKGQRKLILSGSPLHNNVTELWSLFDFLNPGFLGSESIFEQTYTKHLMTNLKKINEKTNETTEFTGALENLKQRIAPFILRRTKQDALKDLPPKIIQDYNCKTSPIQELLLRELNQKHSLDCKPNEEDNELMLERIQWHLYLANHPKLLIKRSIERSNSIISKEVIRSLKQDYGIDDWKKIGMEHSGKMMNLKQLLIECGILTDSMLAGNNFNESNGAPTNFLELIESQPMAHRALIFCQKVSMLDIIENEFLKLYPSLRYVRLDSRVPAEDRVDLARRFNEDGSIPLMLLTTKVGGYGLTLTGADTVIFYDHDWNPMNDLQAMDRTHRIGQSRTVNVYRLILLGTIEERVMNIQKFKQNLAKSLIENERTTSDKLKLQEMFESFAEKADSNTTKKKSVKMSYVDEVAMNWAKLDNDDDLE